MSNNKFTDEFRSEATKLVTQQGYSVAKAAEAIGVSGMTMRNWISKYGSTDQSDLEKEVAVLREQNRILTMERDILKKAATYFAKESN